MYLSQPQLLLLDRLVHVFDWNKAAQVRGVLQLLARSQVLAHRASPGSLWCLTWFL